MRYFEVDESRDQCFVAAEQNAYLGLDLADRCYVLQNGSVGASGEASDLFESELVKKAYLGM